MKRSVLIILIVAIVGLITVILVGRSMSNDVLESFSIINEQLEEANRETDVSIDSVLAETSTFLKETRLNMVFLDSITSALSGELEDIKKALLTSVSDPDDYERMDSPDAGDTYFFSNEEISENGERFLDHLDGYLNALALHFEEEYPDHVADAKELLSTQPVTTSDGREVPWLAYNFKGFPLIASVTKLTQMQADIKSIRSDILSEMLSTD